MSNVVSIIPHLKARAEIAAEIAADQLVHSFMTAPLPLSDQRILKRFLNLCVDKAIFWYPLPGNVMFTEEGDVLHQYDITHVKTSEILKACENRKIWIQDNVDGHANRWRILLDADIHYTLVTTKVIGCQLLKEQLLQEAENNRALIDDHWSKVMPL